MTSQTNKPLGTPNDVPRKPRLARFYHSYSDMSTQFILYFGYSRHYDCTIVQLYCIYCLARRITACIYTAAAHKPCCAIANGGNEDA